MTVEKPAIVFVGTNGQNVSPGGNPALAVVCHIMEGTLAGCDSWFSNPAAQASSNYGIGADGTIHCYVDPFAASPDWAWANGDVNNPDASGVALVARGSSMYGQVSPNVYTVSIEHEGYSGQPVPDPLRAASVQLCAYLCQEFGIVPVHGGNTDTVLGHYQIDSVNRSGCPGWSAAFWGAYVEEVASLLAPSPAPAEPTIAEARKYASDAAARIDSAIANLQAAKESLQF